MSQAITDYHTYGIDFLFGFTEVPVLGINPDRVAIIFVAPVGAPAQFGQADLLSYLGVVVSVPANGSVILLKRDVGELVNAAWIGSCPAGAAIGSVTEIVVVNRRV